MAEWWTLNASPVIVLARVGYEHLLLELPDRVVIPQAVAFEIEAGPEGDAARRVLASGRFTVSDTPSPPLEVVAWDLGRGETSVLAHAIANPGWTVILDDAAARRCARSYALPLKGTLAVILLARKRGLIPSAAELLRMLRNVGFRLDDTIIRQALAQTTGEKWP